MNNYEKSVLESLDSIQRILTQLSDEVKNLTQISNQINMPEEFSKSSTETTSIEVTVSKYLEELGVPKNIRGYQYLRLAIILKFKKEDEMQSITKELYPAVAEEFHSTSIKVERAIRHAIEVAWNRGCVEKQHELFGYIINSKKGKPTNGEFIDTLVDALKLKRL